MADDTFHPGRNSRLFAAAFCPNCQFSYVPAPMLVSCPSCGRDLANHTTETEETLLHAGSGPQPLRARWPSSSPCTKSLAQGSST